MIDLFLGSVYAQLAGIALFMAGLHVYAWIKRGRAHFLSELMVYLTAFLAFSIAQAAISDPDITRIVIRRGFGLLALALWVHVILMVRSMVRALLGFKDDS